MAGGGEGGFQRAPNTPEFSHPRLSRVKVRSSPTREYKFGCVCSYMAGHYPGILMTGHIGTDTPKLYPLGGGPVALCFFQGIANYCCHTPFWPTNKALSERMWLCKGGRGITFYWGVFGASGYRGLAGEIGSHIARS